MIQGGVPEQLAFSVLTEKEIDGVSDKEFRNSLNFMAPSKEHFDKWMDGLNALLQQCVSG